MVLQVEIGSNMQNLKHKEGLSESYFFNFSLLLGMFPLYSCEHEEERLENGGG